MSWAPFARNLPSLAAAIALATSLSACGPNDQKLVGDGGADFDGASLVDGGINPDANIEPADLETLLSALRLDRDAAMLDQSRNQGWPASVAGGYLFVSTEGLGRVAGDHDDWAGAEMHAEDDFYWLVLQTDAGSRYKFTDGSNWLADKWSRAYAWDSEGEMSMLPSVGAHLERYFQVGDSNISERRLRIWIPEGTPTHVLYVHDGQNLFDPNAFFGGWQLNANAPASLMMVGIDNSDQRMSEYTHVSDSFGGGSTGGLGDQYAAYVNTTVRGLVQQHYGEPAKVGTMGSSLGGLISLHIADRFPGQYDFAASLSGTLGWGSMGGQGTDTMIARYLAGGHRDTALYIDSGGNGTTCADTDGDGTNDDDQTASDNYCETRQLEATLVGLGYEYDTDLWHWWEPDAPHNEAAWAARVFRPLQDFMSL